MEGKIITGNSSLSGKSKLKMAIYGYVMYLQVIWTGTVPVPRLLDRATGELHNNVIIIIVS